MIKKLRIGYVPLTDAALLHVAKAQRFAADRGLDIELVAQSSWANIRDKLAAGHFDAAHMLAPAAIAVSLGIGQIKSPLVAPVALGLNGNAITVSRPLLDALLQAAQGDIADPRVTARALALIAAKRREAGAAPLTFGHVFPFSSHHYQLRLWMRAGGIRPDEDVRLAVVPPPFMVDTLLKGTVDGFCVGAPWNSLAVAAGAGAILHQGTDIVGNCPEKVLAFRAEWALTHQGELTALAAAVGDASRWASGPSNRSALITLLASAAGHDVTPGTIERILGGPVPAPPGSALAAAGLRLDEDAIKADPAQALWLFAQMAAAGQAPYSSFLAESAAAVYAPDLGPPNPHPAPAPIAFGGPPFSLNDIPAYLTALESSTAQR
ncbi:MAG: ABC transporter substrate-binding protein [Beijerinckiaceae bacterium]|nr:ABC transporter substrate-binding protein [Beijerinckiaceae bacterium]